MKNLPPILNDLLLIDFLKPIIKSYEINVKALPKHSLIAERYIIENYSSDKIGKAKLILYCSKQVDRCKIELRRIEQNLVDRFEQTKYNHIYNKENCWLSSRSSSDIYCYMDRTELIEIQLLKNHRIIKIEMQRLSDKKNQEIELRGHFRNKPAFKMQTIKHEEIDPDNESIRNFIKNRNLKLSDIREKFMQKIYGQIEGLEIMQFSKFKGQNFFLYFSKDIKEKIDQVLYTGKQNELKLNFKGRFQSEISIIVEELEKIEILK